MFKILLCVEPHYNISKQSTEITFLKWSKAKPHMDFM